MNLPKTYKGFAKLLIAIAEHGNDYKIQENDNGKLHEWDQMNFGEVIADIQNWCGSNEITLGKLDLKYNQ